MKLLITGIQFEAFFNGIKQGEFNNGRLSNLDLKFEDCSEAFKKQITEEFNKFLKRRKA